MELISRFIKSENRRRKLEHAKRVLGMIKSKYKRDLNNPEIEVKRLRLIERKFLEKTLIANEARLSPTKAQEMFWNNNNYRNRHLPKKFSNLKEFPNGDVCRYSITGLDLPKTIITDYITGKTFKPDLEKGTYVYCGEIFFTTNVLGVEVGNCIDCEKLNNKIIYNSGKYYGRGLVLKLDGVAIGYIKLKGERSLLCSRTVIDKDGKLLFIKGMVYSIDPNMEAFVKEKLRVQKNWPSVNLEDIQKDWFGDVDRRHKLRFRHMRFIESEEIFKKIDEFNEKFDREL